MGKIKEKQSEPWKPSISQNDSFISKNKKRKEKRLAKKLAIQKAETAEFIPVKKTALGASSKINHAANGFELSPKNKKGNAFLSTSLPVKGNKKAKMNALNNSLAPSKPSTPAKPQTTTKPVGKLPKKVTGILSNPNTPKKNKRGGVTFEDDKVKAKKYLDDEAEEGEEPVTDKVVKPYEKKGKQKVAVQMEDDSDNDSDDDQFDSAIDFMDMEASEGEETDDESDDEASGSDDDDSDFSSFLAKDDEDESCDEDEEDSDEDEDDSEEDVKPKSDKSVKSKFDKTVKPKLNKMEDANEEEEDNDSDESDDEDEKPAVKPVPTSKNVKQNQPAEKQGKNKPKTAVETPVKSKPVAEEVNKAKSDTPAKTKQEKAAEKKQKKLEQKTATKNEAEKVKPDQQKQEKKEFDRPSNFIGFIRDLSSKYVIVYQF